MLRLRCHLLFTVKFSIPEESDFSLFFQTLIKNLLFSVQIKMKNEKFK